jgi:hypothetical protein
LQAKKEFYLKKEIRDEASLENYYLNYEPFTGLFYCHK